MKIQAETLAPPPEQKPVKFEIELPAGIIGFPEHKRGEIFHLPDQLPFQWFRLNGPTLLHFVVIEATSFVPDYTPELYDEDAATIGIRQADDALVLNIVTVADDQSATANLVGPVIINRHTGTARQVVIANHSQYEARHPLVTPS